jgi:hypothetical protein
MLVRAPLPVFVCVHLWFISFLFSRLSGRDIIMKIEHNWSRADVLTDAQIHDLRAIAGDAAAVQPALEGLPFVGFMESLSVDGLDLTRDQDVGRDVAL